MKLVPCKKCGRKFTEERLNVHQPICKGKHIDKEGINCLIKAITKRIIDN